MDRIINTNSTSEFSDLMLLYLFVKTLRLSIAVNKVVQVRDAVFAGSSPSIIRYVIVSYYASVVLLMT